MNHQGSPNSSFLQVNGDADTTVNKSNLGKTRGKSIGYKTNSPNRRSPRKGSKIR